MAETGLARPAIAAEPAAAPSVPESDRFARPAWLVVAAAAAVGVLGQLLFFGVDLGINFPLAVATVLVAGWLLRRTAHPRPAESWIAPTAVLLAAFAALRADPVVVFLDVMASLALATAALAAYGGGPVVVQPLVDVFGVGVRAAGSVAVGAASAVGAALREVRPSNAISQRASSAAPVLRGIAIAAPIVLVFTILFASADAVFAQVVERLFSVDLELGDVIGRTALAVALAWLTAGALSLARSAPASPSPARERTTDGGRLGTTEAVIVLVAVDALFAVFVALQGAYLFGGLDTLSAAGLTYAEYARRGFFELVAVVVLAGTLVVVVDRTIRGRTRAAQVSGVGLAVLMGVVLASAALRLRLYQEAYGWTELRLYVLATMVVLAIGLIGLLLALLSDRVRWMGHVLLAATLVVGVGLNAIGPVRFITEQNVARLLNPQLVPPRGQTGLDEYYAVSLSDDAIPDLIRALPALPRPEAALVRSELARRLAELRSDPALTAWQAWNAGRASARAALEEVQAAGILR